jgi:hypothetical protein
MDVGSVHRARCGGADSRHRNGAHEEIVSRSNSIPPVKRGDCLSCAPITICSVATEFKASRGLGPWKPRLLVAGRPLPTLLILVDLIAPPFSWHLTAFWRPTVEVLTWNRLVLVGRNNSMSII